jgi:membrane protein DedA with SNARE-associated domain
MESIEPLLRWLHVHLFAVVLLSSFVDATGIPFPGRAVLIAAGIAASTADDVALLVSTAALGALLGDHVLYYAGKRGGPRLLTLYCRLSLGSAQCVEETLRYFRRFGAPAVLLARFSTSIRLFAAILAGTGHIRYSRFVLLDIVGTLLYTGLWITLGFLVGDLVLAHAGRYTPALFLIVPVTLLAVLAIRLVRRRRHGAASANLFSPGTPGGGLHRPSATCPPKPRNGRTSRAQERRGRALRRQPPG